MIEERCYYACSATISSVDHLFLWYSDDSDGVELDGDRVVTFRSLDSLRNRCAEVGLQLSDHAVVKYDLDKVDAWILSPEAHDFDIAALLDVWNLMDDFYASLFGCSAIEEKDLDLHRRLSLSSFANSIPGAIAEEGHDPRWTCTDRSRIARILADTTTKFKASL